MYIALESFTTKNYDVRRKQILEEDFTTQEEIDEYLNIGYIKEYDGTLEITENGQYDVTEYESADVNVASQPNLQNKSLTITTNETQTISADSQYDGLGTVEITTNVAGSSALPNGTKFGYSSALPSSLDTSEVTNMQNMFASCTSLTSVPTIDTSNVTNMSGMFTSCQALTSIPTMNTEKVTDMSRMFYDCNNLTSVPTMNTSNVTSMSRMFYHCYKIASIPSMNTSKVTSMQEMFESCNLLTTLPALDTSSCTNMTNMFRYGTIPLSNESLNNVLLMCINSKCSTKTLTSLGLSSEQKATCQTLSNWEAFVAAGWSA